MQPTECRSQLCNSVVDRTKRKSHAQERWKGDSVPTECWLCIFVLFGVSVLADFLAPLTDWCSHDVVDRTNALSATSPSLDACDFFACSLDLFLDFFCSLCSALLFACRLVLLSSSPLCKSVCVCQKMTHPFCIYQTNWHDIGLHRLNRTHKPRAGWMTPTTTTLKIQICRFENQTALYYRFYGWLILWRPHQP